MVLYVLYGTERLRIQFMEAKKALLLPRGRH